MAASEWLTVEEFAEIADRENVTPEAQQQIWTSLTDGMLIEELHQTVTDADPVNGPALLRRLYEHPSTANEHQWRKELYGDWPHES